MKEKLTFETNVSVPVALVLRQEVGSGNSPQLRPLPRSNVSDFVATVSRQTALANQVAVLLTDLQFSGFTSTLLRSTRQRRNGRPVCGSSSIRPEPEGKPNRRSGHSTPSRARARSRGIFEVPVSTEPEAREARAFKAMGALPA
jgi:hypothetical protein